MDQRKLQKTLERLQYGRRVINDIEDARHYQHSCSRELCNPLNEMDLLRMGALPPNTRPIMPNVWMCRYRNYHVCGDQCSRATEGVCPISGAVFADYVYHSDYNAQDSRTWNAPREEIAINARASNEPAFHLPVSKRRKRMGQSGVNLFGSDYLTEAPPPPPPPPAKADTGVKRTVNTGRLGQKEARNRVEKLVNRLLFDEKLRKRAVEQHQINYETLRARSWSRYTEQCVENKRVVNLIGHLIADSNLFRALPPPPEPVDALNGNADRYTALLMQVYTRACEILTQPKVDVEALGIAALYLMRAGYPPMFSADAYLARQLPQVNDLPLFFYPKQKMTKGLKLIKTMYAMAKNQQELSLIRAEQQQQQQHEQVWFKPTSRKWKLPTKT